MEVRAKNAEGTSEWSNPGNGATNEPGANNPPVFSDGASATRSVSASSPTGTPIGEPVTATDADTGDTLTYSLEGRDAASFAINETNGQILTKSGVTLIAGETYTVTVAVDDGTDIAQDYGFDRGYRCASQQPAGILRGRDRHAERVRGCGGGH